MLTKSNTMKIERKGKNKSLIKTPSTTTRISSKKKIELPIKNEKKNAYKILSKDYIQKKTQKNYKYNNKILSNNQILMTSNYVLSTNCSDKEEEKKRILSNNIIEEKHLRYLGNLFRKSNLKKTIIIDNEGNNNLNLNKNIFLDNKEHKINFQKIKNKIICYRYDNKNLVKKDKYKKTCHNKVISENIIPSSMKLKDINLINKNDKKLNKYGIIFNLFNNNIEEMKDIFKKSPLRKKENDNIFINENTNFKNEQIFSEKDKEEINNIKPLNDNEKKDNENSFFENCIKDDFYKNFVDENQIPQINISNCSFDFSSLNSEKSSSIIINTNSDKTICEIDENINSNDNNFIHNFNINPHTLISKKNEKKIIKKYKNGSKSTSNINVSNENKCSVF